jgi:hypothetical protein
MVLPLRPSESVIDEDWLERVKEGSIIASTQYVWQMTAAWDKGWLKTG